MVGCFVRIKATQHGFVPSYFSIRFFRNIELVDSFLVQYNNIESFVCLSKDLFGIRDSTFRVHFEIRFASDDNMESHAI